MSNLLSIEQVNQDPAVQIILPEATALSVDANWATIMNNFGKIGGWIMQGEASPNPLPPVLKAASDQLSNNTTAIGEMRDAYKGIQQAYTQIDVAIQASKAEDIALFDHIMAMKKEMAEMVGVIKELQAAAPAKKTRAKKEEPKVEEPVAEPVIEAPAVAATPAAVEPDEVELTAAAVGAGQLDSDALNALDGLLMQL